MRKPPLSIPCRVPTCTVFRTRLRTSTTRRARWGSCGPYGYDPTPPLGLFICAAPLDLTIRAAQMGTAYLGTPREIGTAGRCGACHTVPLMSQDGAPLPACVRASVVHSLRRTSSLSLERLLRVSLPSLCPLLASPAAECPPVSR